MMAALRLVLPLASIRRAASRATSSATSGTPKKNPVSCGEATGGLPPCDQDNYSCLVDIHTRGVDVLSTCLGSAHTAVLPHEAGGRPFIFSDSVLNYRVATHTGLVLPK